MEHVPANIVHPGVKMFRNQPVADGPAGPDRRRRLVGTDGRHAVHDTDRPTAGGPVGRFSSPGPLKPSRMSSLGESYQPFVGHGWDICSKRPMPADGWWHGGPTVRFRPDGPQGNVILGMQV